jgi:hypothetical protein
MFKTHDADMVGVPGMFGEGQYQWSQVSRILRTHWYHVTLQAKQEGRKRTPNSPCATQAGAH